MRIEIDIPKEFEEHFKHDKFKDSLERIMADIRHSLNNRDCLCAGIYEYEIIKMLEKVFEDSKTAYDIDKAVEDVRCRCYELGLDESQTEIIVSEIVKHGGVADDVCEWELDGDNLITSCDNYFNLYDNCTGKFKYCPVCGKKIKVIGVK